MRVGAVAALRVLDPDPLEQRHRLGLRRRLRPSPRLTRSVSAIWAPARIVGFSDPNGFW